MTPRQVRRMIRQESIVTSLLGTTLGLAIGAALAAVTSIALADYGIALAIPIGTLATFVLVAIPTSGRSRTPSSRTGSNRWRPRSRQWSDQRTECTLSAPPTAPASASVPAHDRARVDRPNLAPGAEERAARPIYEALGGDQDLARAAFAFAHGMTILELNNRFPQTADVAAAWKRGLDALRTASTTRPSATSVERTGGR